MSAEQYPFFGHVIDNVEVESLDGARFDTVNPWTRRKWAEVAQGMRVGNPRGPASAPG